MGIKFDILTDLLAETSNFSKFFTSSEPIKQIHSILKVSHDTELVLSPTNNGNVLWDALRDGDAIFVSINKPEEIQTTKKTLIGVFKSLPIPPKRARSYNVIKDAISNVIKKINETPPTSHEFKDISNNFYGKKHNISELINDIYPNETTLKETLLNFIKSIKPGNYILMKRVPTINTSGLEYDSPNERLFPVRKKNPSNPMGGVKIQHQAYMIYTFAGDALLSTKTFNGNAKHAFRSEFEGWGDRDFYVIKNEQFLRTKRHPFVASKDVQFVKILPIEINQIQSFVTDSFNKYEKIIKTKINGMYKNEVEPLKQKAYNAIEQENIPDSQINTAIKEYRDVLNIIRTGIPKTDTVKAFRDFINKDIFVDLNDYIIISTITPYTGKMTEDEWKKLSNKWKSPGEERTKWKYVNGEKINDDEEPATYPAYTGKMNAGEWKELTKEDGIKEIKHKLGDGDYVPTQKTKYIKIRYKSNRSNIITMDINELKKDPQLNQCEIYDEDRKRWIPFDPSYISNFITNSGARNVAIAFYGYREYNDFVHKFISFVLRPYTKSSRDLTDVLNAL